MWWVSTHVKFAGKAKNDIIQIYDETPFQFDWIYTDDVGNWKNAAILKLRLDADKIKLVIGWVWQCPNSR